METYMVIQDARTVRKYWRLKRSRHPQYSTDLVPEMDFRVLLEVNSHLCAWETRKWAKFGERNNEDSFFFDEQFYIDIYNK